MASKTEICNLAISHLGTSKEIQDFITDKSEEAVVCRRFYEIAKDTSLRDFPWPFVRKFMSLQLVQENPTSEWAYSYRYPIAARMIKKILSGNRNDTAQSRQPYLIASDDAGRLIYTDKVSAEIEYTGNTDDPNFFPPDFTMALSYLLASYIAPRITGGNAFGEMTKTLFNMYQIHLAIAKQNAFNEQQADQVHESEFMRGRN